MTERPRHVHLIAICGVGMAPLAVMLKRTGWRVTGSDAAIFPPMSDVLAAAGIEVSLGFSAERLEALRPDLVIVGNAVTRANVEAVAAERWARAHVVPAGARASSSSPAARASWSRARTARPRRRRCSPSVLEAAGAIPAI